MLARALLALTLSATGALVQDADAPPGPVSLVEGTTTTAHLAVPYPGHTADFDLTARAGPDGPSDLALLVDAGTGPLADGPDALRLVLTGDDGTVIAAGTAAELGASPVDLGRLGAEPVTVHGSAELPSSAGDDLQGEGVTLRLTLVASQVEAGAAAVVPDLPVEAGPDVPWLGALASTGAQGLLALVALVLSTIGLGLLAARRRRRRHEETS